MILLQLLARKIVIDNYLSVLAIMYMGKDGSYTGYTSLVQYLLYDKERQGRCNRRARGTCPLPPTFGQPPKRSNLKGQAEKGQNWPETPLVPPHFETACNAPDLHQKKSL